MKFLKLNRGEDRDLLLAFFCTRDGVKTPLDLSRSELTLCIHCADRVVRVPGVVEGEEHNVVRCRISGRVDLPDDTATCTLYRRTGGRTQSIFTAPMIIEGDRPNVL